MNIIIPDSWLREYLQTNATPKDIQRCLSLCGPSVERITKKGNDYLYDIEVTTNRVDCMSIYGIAREAVAILPQFGFSATLKPIDIVDLKKGELPGFIIKNDPNLCKRILAVRIDQVKVEPSPKWLTDRLTQVGIRPINNLVDLTNYVMWETGHPAHVFDFSRISQGKMIIREAEKNEKIITLDDKTHVLKGGEVVIDNGQGNIIDLPSVMGTINSVVIPTTISALFFIDSVESSKVRFASMTHAIRTQAATLLEKDVDPELGLTAISRIIKILTQILPQSKISPLLDIYPKPLVPKPITVSYSQFSKVIGIEISKNNIQQILKSLNFNLRFQNDNFIITPPSYRASDIRIPEDLIEEISRIYGYHNIPSILMSGVLPDKLMENTFAWESKIKTVLKYLGFTESYTYSLVENELHGLKLSNPLSSDWSYLRTALTPSHQKLISENIGKSDDLYFFELADVYLPQKNKLPVEEMRLIISSNSHDIQIFKGRIEAFLLDLQINLEPEIVTLGDYKFWEISLSTLILHAKTAKTYTPISKFMPVTEDFNIILNSSYSKLASKIKALSKLITQIDLIDKYEAKLTLRLTFHDPNRQLSKEDISSVRTQIENLSNNLD